jgi:hypothetical protein
MLNLLVRVLTTRFERLLLYVAPLIIGYSFPILLLNHYGLKCMLLASCVMCVRVCVVLCK